MDINALHRAYIPPFHSLYGIHRHSNSLLPLIPLRPPNLPPSTLPLPGPAGASFGPSLSRARACTSSRGSRRTRIRWGWYGTRRLDCKPLGFPLLLLAPRMHRLDDQAADRARDDKEGPLGDARDDLVELGLPDCEYIDVLLTMRGLNGKYGGRGE
jgi:hypothetical protein